MKAPMTLIIWLTLAAVIIPFAVTDDTQQYVVLVDLGESQDGNIVDDVITKLETECHVTTIESAKAGQIALLVLKGTEHDMAMGMEQIPALTHCERDVLLHLDASCLTQTLPPPLGLLWGLDRIDQTDALTANNFSYIYEDADPSDDTVDVYIVDSGIWTSHGTFQGRASWGYTAPIVGASEPDEDLNGHGTHVAGIVGGHWLGVSRHVNLIAVKVAFQTGSMFMSDVLSGLLWVLNNHTIINTNTGTCDYSKAIDPECHKGVVNLSLGGPGTSNMLDVMLNTLLNNGLAVVVSAGNDATDACTHTPANVKDVITVGATNIEDCISDFSNYGECVDVFAPGTDILSSWPLPLGINGMILNGTSMAAPFVSGALTNFMMKTNQRIDRQIINEWLKDHVQKKKIKLMCHQKCSPNKLLYVPCP